MKIELKQYKEKLSKFEKIVGDLSKSLERFVDATKGSKFVNVSNCVNEFLSGSRSRSRVS